MRENTAFKLALADIGGGEEKWGSARYKIYTLWWDVLACFTKDSEAEFGKLVLAPVIKTRGLL